jgi:cytochrome P450
MITLAIANYLAFDIMSNVIFGRDFALLDDSKYRPVVEALEASNVRMGVLLQTDSMRTLRMDKKLFPKAVQGRNTFVQFVKNLLADRFRGPETGVNDMMSLLDEGKSDSNKLKKSELLAEGVTLVVAGDLDSEEPCLTERHDCADCATGSDTTATALSGFLFYMSKHQDFLERAWLEVTTAFQASAEIKPGKALSECHFLRACIEETMRMSPPASTVLWREVEGEGIELGGYHVPAGCEVGVSIYNLHHNEQYHPEPFVFNPDRRSLGEENEKLSGVALMPFSIGPRSCIGRSLALQELMVTTAHLLWRFDMKFDPADQMCHLPSGHPSEYALGDHVTSATEGPWIRWRLRQARSQGFE